MKDRRLKSSGWQWPLLLFLLLAVVLIVKFQITPTVVVDDELLRAALASKRPQRPTMSDSIEFFSQRLTQQPDDHSARERLVQAYLLRFKAYGELADVEVAHKHLMDLIRVYPERAVLYADLAGVELTLHRFDRAAAVIDEALQLRGTQVEQKVLLRQFDVLWARGYYDAAVKVIDTPVISRKTFDFLGRDARLQDRLGNMELAKQRMVSAYHRAKAYAEPAIVVAWTLLEWAHFEFHSGEPRKAVALLAEALQRLPGYPAALAALAEIAYGVDRNLPVARSLYLHAIANGGEADLYLPLMDIEDELGRSHEADEYRQRFLQAVAKYPQHEQLFYRPLALLLAQSPETRDKALAYANKDLQLRQNSTAYHTLGWVLYQQGDLSGAKAALLKAAAWGEAEPTVAYHLGYVLFELGERAAAKPHLEAALSGSVELGHRDVAECRRRLRLI